MTHNFRFREEWLAAPGPDFSWPSALALVSACKVAYHPGPDAERVVAEDWGLSGQAFDMGDTQGIVIEGQHAVVVAFRGTESVADWLGNLTVTPRFVPDFRGALHKGFHNAYRDAAPIVDAAVARAGTRALWFTGHSLGGALAVIAAMTHDDHDIAGLMTFGQPLLLGRRPARWIGEHLAGRYYRFVNREDIVTRVPPGYSHAGERIHFTGSGAGDVTFGVEGGLESGLADTEEEMPAAEFIALQETIDAIATELETGAGAARAVEGLGLESAAPPPDVLLDASVEGLVPGVSDHRIDAYVAEVNARAAAEISVAGMHETFMGRRDDEFRRAAASITEEPLFDPGFGLESGVGPEAADTAAATACYLVRLRDAHGWAPPEGVSLRSVVGNIASVAATETGVRNLSTDPAALTIEPSREAGIEELTVSVPHVKGTAVHTRPDLHERGDRALVGIIDTGIDILHRAFDDAAGASRIHAIWIQWDNTGPTPHQVDPAFTQNYGTFYLAEDIARFRAAFDADGTAPPPGLRDEFSGHGTHVASIAAGRGVGDLGDGMAPDAGIVLVAAHTSRAPDNPDEPRSIGYSASHVDALGLLKRIAGGGTAVLADPRPMAINVSLGMNAGAHDGQTTLEAAFDGVTGNGREPGLVIVKSAGNERGHGGHASVQAALGAVVDVEWTTDFNSRPLDYLEAWFEPGNDIEFSLLTPDGAIIGPVSFDAPEAEVDGPGYRCRLSLSEGHSDNAHNRLAISVDRKTGGQIPAGGWKLDVLARNLVGANAMVHIWAERVGDRSVRFRLPDPAMTLSIPGTARSVVTVGACNSGFPMRLLSASSLGLTRDGRPKPELCAPGEGIWAARANAGPTDRTQKSGTSMAAPHVTGALALVLSAREKSGKPQLNAVQLREKLRLTTQNFSHIHNPGFGSGVLDAEALLNESI
jgi:subtilisin family serine protease